VPADVHLVGMCTDQCKLLYLVEPELCTHRWAQCWALWTPIVQSPDCWYTLCCLWDRLLDKSMQTTTYPRKI